MASLSDTDLYLKSFMKAENSFWLVIKCEAGDADSITLDLRKGFLTIVFGSN